jgi:HAD superfamily hydrolase (TIGR01490 family)
MIGAFFDVDGTLYTANMWRGLMQYAQAHGRARDAKLYYNTLVPLYLMRKLKLISEETFRKPWVLSMGKMLKGWSQAEGDAAFDWIAEEFIRPTAHEDIVARLREHVAQHHIVVLVSAMLAPTLAGIGKPLGVTGTVGTEVEVRDGKFTGRVLPPACMGIQKERLTKKFLTARGIEIDFVASYAYADSISDLPLFEMVGKPVAVYPDKELAALAREKNWEILGKNRVAMDPRSSQGG